MTDMGMLNQKHRIKLLTETKVIKDRLLPKTKSYIKFYYCRNIMTDIN